MKPKDKFYRQYIIAPTNKRNKNSKYNLFGIDSSGGVAIKICVLDSEEEANKMKNVFQLRANVYFELRSKIYSSITGTKAGFNSSKLQLVNYNELVKQVIKNVSSEYFKNNELAIKISEISKSSR